MFPFFTPCCFVHNKNEKEEEEEAFRLFLN